MAGRPEEPTPELDLLPILNLVLIIIPLLLLGLVFVEIAVLDVSMASKSPAPATPPTEAPPPKLQVLVKSDGEFVISMNDVPMADGPIKAKAATQENPLDRYDWCSFYNILIKAKNGDFGLDYSKVQQFDMILAEDVIFDVMVKTMDVARFGRVLRANMPSEGELELKPFPPIPCDGEDVAFNESRTPRLTIEEAGQKKLGRNNLFPGAVLGMPSRN